MSSLRGRPGAATWAVGVVGGSLLLALILSAHPESLEGRLSAGSDSYSYSLLGYRAWATVIERSGFEVTRRRTRSLSHLEESTLVVVAEPYGTGGPAVSPDSVIENHLGEYPVEGARLLVVLPKWSGIADVGRPGWLERMTRLPAREVASVAANYGFDSLALVDVPPGTTRFATAWEESVSVDVPGLRAHAEDPRWKPIVWRDSLVLLSRSIRVDTLVIPGDAPDEAEDTLISFSVGSYLATDPDLFNNRGIAQADHARLLRRFLQEEAGARRVVFDETTHHGFLQGSLAAAMLRFPLVLLLIQALLLLGFLAWARATRFGSPRPLPPRPRSGAALISATADLLASAGTPAETLLLYWQQVLRDVAARCGVAGAAHRDLVGALTELGRRRGIEGEASALDHDVEMMQRGDGGAPSAVLALARSIQHWHRGMVHGL